MLTGGGYSLIRRYPPVPVVAGPSGPRLPGPRLQPGVPGDGTATGTMSHRAGPESASVFAFEGPLHNIYATLAVRRSVRF
jgi:hypothetical protein